MLKALKFLFYVEIVLLLRRSQDWLYPLAFFLIVISLFPLAFTPDPAFLQKFIPGAIWIAALLSSLLAVQNIFFSETEDGNLDQLLLSPLPLTGLLYAKLGAVSLITQLPLILLTPILGILFHLNLQIVLLLSLSLLLGSPVLILMGSLAAALTLGLRQQGMLLGLIIFPLVIPILIFSIHLVQQQTESNLSILPPLAFLAGLSVLAFTLLPWVIANALRVSLDT